ncbi:RloB domain-containing protein [Sphingosinicella sp.]|uniref:RloB domain-containing protein n=1 Tax=Sphingosinicella sp. TaxID=1917971 RepID=UPI0040382035
MSYRRRPLIEPRRPIFFGCEGQCETGYGALLAGFADDAGIRVHLEIVDLAPAGDPLARVEKAEARIAHLRRRRGTFAEKFILLDGDQKAENPQRTAQAIALAARLGIALVWQEPCHEALLLRHLPGRAAARPPTSQAALQALQNEWQEYAKPMTRVDLTPRIDLAGALRAAAVEPDLTGLLRAIGLINEEA